ncbi:MAG: hypothetical protein ACFFEK_13720 [Candidatus Thorarchaeota archaeon]
MAESIVTYKSLSKLYAAIILGTIVFFLIGYYVANLLLPMMTWDLFIILTYFIGLPLLVTTLGFYIGWYGKKSTIEYTDPTWPVEVVQMSIDDAKTLVGRNNRKYWRLVSISNFWTFFIPIALLLFMAGFPVYLLFESPSLAGFESLIFALALSLAYLVSSVGSFLATSNAATEDFDILLVREAIDLAKNQEKVPGLSYVRVVFDKGEIDGYEMYESPRVVSRISGIEKDAYIESWSDDLHTVTRVLCRLHKSDDSPQIIWWWMARDRNFRKFVDDDEKGYYVRLPVQSSVKFPGVKDVRTVFENAVAILSFEWLKTRGKNDQLSHILDELNATSSEG